MDNEGLFIDITDDEGNQFSLEVIDEVEYRGELYRLYLPADMDESDDDYGYIILRVGLENGEELLYSVDDDDLLQEIYDAFMERLFAEDEEE